MSLHGPGRDPHWITVITWVLNMSEMTGWIQVHEMLYSCLFLVPITSPETISCVGSLSHVKSFLFRLRISLLPLRTVQKGFPETQHYFPLGSCHIPFPWTKICGFYLVSRKPTCPSRVSGFKRIITRSNFDLYWASAGRQQHKEHSVVSNFWWT